MSNTNITQQEQALDLAQELFAEISPDEILEELKCLFMGYLDSDLADFDEERTLRSFAYFRLETYFKDMKALNC